MRHGSSVSGVRTGIVGKDMNLQWECWIKKMFKLRPEQERCHDEAYSILSDSGWVYLCMEVRTGKTHTALALASSLDAKNVLFVTTKTVINSGTITDDYDTQGCEFELDQINYESLHKVEGDYDLIVWDEAHLMGAFPKASKRAKQAYELKRKTNYNIFLSGTPTPESYSQWFHQLIGVKNNPIAFKSFYPFANKFVNIETRYRGGGQTFKDYSDCREEVNVLINPFIVSSTQKQAGFETEVEDVFVNVTLADSTHDLIAKLKKDKVIVMGDGEDAILADTAVKELSKVHQMASGTVKTENGKTETIDNAKIHSLADILQKEKKIAVFYKYIGEREAILSVFGDKFTTDLQEFYNDPSKSLVINVRSGAKGITLKQASALVMFNIDFSAELFIQSRNRLSTQDRLDNRVIWLFSDHGIERAIYNTVMDKMSFTTKHYNKLK